MFYTQAEIHELIQYAHDRGIRVIPEFDTPGHSRSWFVGYPELASGDGPFTVETEAGPSSVTDPTREETYKFMDKFVAEMESSFPTPISTSAAMRSTVSSGTATPRSRPSNKRTA